MVLLYIMAIPKSESECKGICHLHNELLKCSRQNLQVMQILVGAGALVRLNGTIYNAPKKHGKGGCK